MKRSNCNKCDSCYYDGVCDRTICKPLYPAVSEDGTPVEEPFNPWDGEPDGGAK